MVPALLALIPAITGIIDKFIPDRDAADKARAEITDKIVTQIGEQAKQQSDTNSVEAGHRTIFVAGWRPWIGWVCGMAMFLYFLVFPLVDCGMHIYTTGSYVRPELDMETVSGILMGMLGLGGLRTIEKIKGITK